MLLRPLAAALGAALSDRYFRVPSGRGFLTEAVELRLAVRDALDREYTASPDVTADRSPGRTLTLGVSGRF